MGECGMERTDLRAAQTTHRRPAALRETAFAKVKSVLP
jgi:hypothetical protein